MTTEYKNPHRGRGPGSAPGGAHAQEVDKEGPDLDALVHHNARVICEQLGKPCGCQGNLPDGTCIDGNSPCRFAPEDLKGSRASGRPPAVGAPVEPPKKK
jgi:hypothetical protein